METARRKANVVGKDPKTNFDLYDKPVYWSLPNDGADFHCSECRKGFSHTEVYLTQTPWGKREVLCKPDICEDWLESAVYLGLFKV